MDKPLGSGQKVKTDAAQQDYAIVCFLEDAEQANDYVALLEANDVPAVVQQPGKESDEESFVVLVPEEYVDEAHVVIESQSSYDEFGDLDDESFYDDEDLDDSF